jgi:hypothetical protein
MIPEAKSKISKSVPAASSSPKAAIAKMWALDLTD